MSCYHPIKAFRTPHGVVFSELRRHDIIGTCEIPCGQCLGCRLRRAHDWSLRITHEAQMWKENCFITLTYSDEYLPADGSLKYRDYQLFMMRLRKRMSPKGIRFFMCGEYGPLNRRPHYHAVLFNHDFHDRVVAGRSASREVFYKSAELLSLWKLGHVSVQDVTQQSAAYCARYIVDKVTGDAAEHHYRSVDSDGVVCQRVPEFCHCSLRPGIGAAWFSRYGDSDVFRHDFVVHEGTRSAVPRYYDKLKRRSKDVLMDEIEFKRVERARRAAPDNTDERLAVREVVHKARVSSLKRSI